jgi:hypothetical protein
VLRFFGYFLESVVESNIENYRVRVSEQQLPLSPMDACGGWAGTACMQLWLQQECAGQPNKSHLLRRIVSFVLLLQKVVVLYYLADDSVQVTEPKQDNSGILQVRAMQHVLAQACASCSTVTA